jgi:hypothetical protein
MMKRTFESVIVAVITISIAWLGNIYLRLEELEKNIMHREVLEVQIEAFALDITRIESVIAVLNERLYQCQD